MTRKVVVGITGGIAAYKSVELVRLLQKQRCDVKVIMTSNACQFVQPLTFQALTGHTVVTSMFSDVRLPEEIQHTALADWADITVIAPASANCIGKYANGLADDFLSTYLLAFKKTVLMAPAMNPTMYANPAVQNNLNFLAERGVVFIGPETGKVACGHEGPGKMSDPGLIADTAIAVLGRNGDLKGKKILVSAGPTREWIDPIRFISNRSSGKMGYTIATAAIERGADVTLVSGPVNLKPHPAVSCHSIVSSEEMYAIMLEKAPLADVIIMTAAVADWKPQKKLSQKWKKKDTKTTTLLLEQTTDILKSIAEIRHSRQILVGFAAETQNLVEEAGRKLLEKSLDAIVANDVSQADRGIDSDFNQAIILDNKGNTIDIPLCTKQEMANVILDYCLKRIQSLA